MKTKAPDVNEPLPRLLPTMPTTRRDLPARSLGQLAGKACLAMFIAALVADRLSLRRGTLPLALALIGVSILCASVTLHLFLLRMRSARTEPIRLTRHRIGWGMLLLVTLTYGIMSIIAMVRLLQHRAA